MRVLRARRIAGMATLLSGVLTVGCPLPSLPAAPDLEQQTKDLQLAVRRYRQASGPQRAELEEKLRTLVEQRAADLRSAIDRDPGLLLRVMLPRETYDALPADLQSDVERPVTLDGVVDQPQESTAAGVMRLRDRQGRLFSLLCIGSPPPLVEGASISVDGVQLASQVVAACGPDGRVRSLSRSGIPSTPLAIAFAQPKQGDVVRQTVEVRAALPRDRAIAAIGLYRDGTLLQRRDNPPYTWSWDTRREPDGPHQLSLKAHDPDLNIGDTAVTVTVDNTPPRVTLTSPAAGRHLSGTVSCNAQASDVLGIDTVKFIADGAVIGLAVQPPYTIPWDTTAVPNGPHSIEAIAVDRAGNQARSSATPVTILNGNTPPILTPIGSKTVQEGVTLSFVVLAIDVDKRGEALTFTASDLPPWATFDPVTHRFTGTPGLSVASSAQTSVVYPTVRFEVCDPQPACVHETISITVTNVNRPPVMKPIPDRTLAEHEALTIAPLVTEPDGDPITCTGRGLPPWVALDPKTCTLRGTPPLDTAGQSHPVEVYRGVRLKACDPEDSCAEQSFTITVKDVARKSTLEVIGDKTVEEGRPLRFTVKAGNPDREPIALITTLLPAGAGFVTHGDGTGTFSWTPREDQAGTYEVTFEANDRRTSDAETLTITVKETSLAISGTVTDSYGNAFPGVTVEAASWTDFTRSAVTDEGGNYLIKDLTPNSYRVRPVYSSGLNLPSREGYSFEPFYRQLHITGADQTAVNFTAIQKQ